MLEVKGVVDQIYIRSFGNREISVNSCCGIVMNKLYDLIIAGLV